MKKTVSGLLLLVFLFNLAGYHVLFLGLRQQARHEMMRQLDANHYAADGTITLKIPMALPYQQDRTSYERVDGDFEHKGEFYKLVKQKLQRDTLYVVCIKDAKEKHLAGIMEDFTRLVNDLPGNSTTLKLFSSFQKEYKSATVIELLAAQYGWYTAVNNRTAHSAVLISRTVIVFSPPPEAHS